MKKSVGGINGRETQKNSDYLKNFANEKISIP
jgi:hypothetical protein